MAPRLRSASKRKPTKDDALAFLKAVKDAFKGEKEKFDKFMEILKNSWNLRIGFSEVIESVKELLQGHDYLILDFNIFLPKRYQIKSPKEQKAADREEAKQFWEIMKSLAASDEAQPLAAGSASKDKVMLSDTTAFLTAVKKAFVDEKDKYYKFLEIMMDFKDHRIISVEVPARVKRLFTGLDDLIRDFNNFLPEMIVNYSNGFEAWRFIRKIKNHFRHDENVYRMFSNIIGMHGRGEKNIHETFDMIAELFQDHQDLIEEFKFFLPSRFR